MGAISSSRGPARASCCDDDDHHDKYRGFLSFLDDGVMQWVLVSWVFDTAVGRDFWVSACEGRITIYPRSHGAGEREGRVGPGWRRLLAGEEMVGEGPVSPGARIMVLHLYMKKVSVHVCL